MAKDTTPDIDALLCRLRELYETARQLAASYASYGGYLYSGQVGRMQAFQQAIEAVQQFCVPQETE